MPIPLSDMFWGTLCREVEEEKSGRARTWEKRAEAIRLKELRRDFWVLPAPVRISFSGDHWVVPQDMLQTAASDPCPHDVPFNTAPPGSPNSRMIPRRWTCGRSWRTPVPTSTRRSPSCTASQIWGVCCGGWRRYRRRRRKAKVVLVLFWKDVRA